jgi:hypothetical protein
MQTNANITIYLQALGGKFLGPNAYGLDNITLSITLQDNEPIPITYKLAHKGNDGDIKPNFSYDHQTREGLSSFLPILTPAIVDDPSPAVNYLTPDDLTICGTVSVPVSQPTMLGTISASIPRPQGGALLLTQSIALNQMQADYKVIMVVPGLLLEPLLPPDMTNSIFVYVKMMCGCPITTGIPNSYWAMNDFIVKAEVTETTGRNYWTPLSLTSNTPSLFAAAVDDIRKVRQVIFVARQRSTGNIGYLSVDYSS